MPSVFAINEKNLQYMEDFLSFKPPFKSVLLFDVYNLKESMISDNLTYQFEIFSKEEIEAMKPFSKKSIPELS